MAGLITVGDVAWSAASGAAARRVVVPTVVQVIPTGAFNGVTGSVTYGTHTASKLKVTVPSGLKYVVMYF